MADFVYNIAKGRVTELANRVNNNDPTNSAFIIVAIAANGVTDATLKDIADLSSILATAADEVTQTGYARKTLTDTSSITVTTDNTNDWVIVDMPDQTWSAVAAGGTAWSDLIICYDNDTTSGTDANVVPLVQLDFVATPDGSDIVAQFNASGVYKAA